MTPDELARIRHEAERQYGGSLVIKLLDEYEAQQPYIRHKTECMVYQASAKLDGTKNPPCVCGLDAVLAGSAA